MNEYCGIILAGGKGTRLMPLTEHTNKHLLPVGGKPMIDYPVEKLTQIGIRDIMVVTGADHIGQIIDHLGSGAKFGCRFTYRIQDEANGIAGALGLCESFVGGRNCIVILGDYIFTFPLWRAYNSHLENGHGAMVVLKEVESPERYGVAVLEEGGSGIDHIEEKPKKPVSKFAVTGIYIYDSKVWGYLPKLVKSRRGEFEITDINNAYLRDMDLDHVFEARGEWTDAGTPESLQAAQEIVRAA